MSHTSLQFASLLGCCHSQGLQLVTPLDLCLRCGLCPQGAEDKMVFDATHFLVRLLVQTLDALVTGKQKLGLIAKLNEGKHS